MVASVSSQVNMQSVQHMLRSAGSTASKLFKQASSKAPMMGNAAANMMMNVASLAAKASEASGKVAQAADRVTIANVKTASLSHPDDPSTSDIMLKVARSTAQAAKFADKASSFADKAAEGAAKFATRLSVLADTSASSTESPSASEDTQPAGRRQDGPPISENPSATTRPAQDETPSTQLTGSKRLREDDSQITDSPATKKPNTAMGREAGPPISENPDAITRPPQDETPTTQLTGSKRPREYDSQITDSPAAKNAKVDTPAETAPPTASNIQPTPVVSDTAATEETQATETSATQEPNEAQSTKKKGLLSRLTKGIGKFLEKNLPNLNSGIKELASDSETTADEGGSKKGRFEKFASSLIEARSQIKSETKESLKDLKKDLMLYILSPEQFSKDDLASILTKIDDVHDQVSKSVTGQLQGFMEKGLIPEKLVNKLGGDKALGQMGRAIAGALMGKKEIYKSMQAAKQNSIRQQNPMMAGNKNQQINNLLQLTQNPQLMEMLVKDPSLLSTFMHNSSMMSQLQNQSVSGNPQLMQALVNQSRIGGDSTQNS
ncbi:hypothetical protein [Agarilytica rhodophyticola]|uniref:hypothetical protein n=1 Tax=Agarilytica rhodophyticola TaxID=1737490 RepID=UPI000B346BF9|nr:hypothetical protein [Agarilytica rhodophyticola]